MTEKLQWLVTEDNFRPGLLAHYESIFALSNGYMGVRASLETNPSLADPGFYIAGVFDKVEGFQHEIVNLPCWLGLGIHVDGFPVDMRKGETLEYRRSLDLLQGILFTHIVWRDAGGHTTRLELGRLVHQTDKHTALQWGTITPMDYSATIRISSPIDAWAVKYGSPHGAPRLCDIATRDLGAGGIAMAASTRATGLRVALATCLTAGEADARAVVQSDDRISETLSVPVRQGEPLRFEKRVSVFTSRDGNDPGERAQAALASLATRPLPELVAAHTAAWAEIWAGADIRIEGDERAQQALRFNIFHLASLANPDDDTVSIGARGLHGNGYCGVYFWDTEIYMLPFYVHTRPAAARALLRYRHRFIDDSRANARDLGYRGAFYPWNSSLTGREQTWRGWQEHVGSDITYGLDWYARATGDREFLHGPGAEIVFETARYWHSRVQFHPERGYEITSLTGPDEIHSGIANNFYTNFLARWNLARAAELAGELRQEGRWDSLAANLGLDDAEVAAWRQISERIHLPFDAARNLHEQFEGYFDLPERRIDRSISRMCYTGPIQHSFRPTKVAQQADTVLAYWMFQESIPAAVQLAGYRYYESRCSHTSSLSRCIYAAVAARAGLVEEAYRQFLLSAEADIAPGAEMESESGIHAACMGGTWLAAVTGFGGAWMRGDTLSFAPRLPGHWKRLAYAIAWRGTTLEVEVEPRGLRLRTRGGETEVIAAGGRHMIGPEWTPWLPVPCDKPENAGLTGLGILFDLDGVLVDTAEHHYQAWKELADRIAVPFDRTRNEELRGVARMDSLLLLLGDHGKRFTAAEKEAMCAEKNAGYVRRIGRIAPSDLLPGARELLESLREAGALLAVASSSRNAGTVLERLGILPLFHAVVDGNDVKAAKPAPDLFLLAAKRLGVAAERCVVVEDAEAGVAAARTAGMRCIGIGDRRRLRDANLVVPSVGAIPLDWLGRAGTDFETGNG
jgi:beta-phosphoglucomutase